MKLSEQKVHNIARHLAEDFPDILYDYAFEYGEPGYSFREDAETPMVWFGDWWKLDRIRFDHTTHRWPRLFQQLEQQGVELEWHDEWTISHEHGGKAFRTQPDCYGWQPAIQWTEEYEYCTVDDLEYLIEAMKNDDSKCINLSTLDPYRDLVPLGWEKHNGTYENGWHPGQTDDPKEIGPAFRRWHPGHDTLWVISGVGQFDVDFQLWHKPPEDEETDVDEPTYQINRYHFQADNEYGILTGLTLEEAQEHCKDPSTSGEDENGPWFDGYEEE